MKINAKQYLKEFADSQSDWLKVLIYETIETNGNISNDRLSDIFTYFIDESTDIEIHEPNINTDINDSEICISRLIHKTGVSALKENQTIKFSKDVTILYGLNGTGKSSYFKILNEIVGGNQKKEILSNIYDENPKEISVDLTYEKSDESNQSKTINWNGNERSLNLLNQSKVFDSSYLNGLLDTRETDSTIIQPLGLNLFTYLVGIIDGFKNQVNNRANEERNSKPNINLEKIRVDIKSAFENNNVSDDIEKEINKLYVFSKEDSEKLEEILKEISNLKQVNTQDKIKILENNKNELEKIKNRIDEYVKNIIESKLDIEKIIGEYLECKKSNDEAKKQFMVLSSIPLNNTDEWKKFIKAGEKYHSKLENEENNVCIYCRQPLINDDSIKIIQAYSSFLKDESEKNLNETVDKLQSLKNRLEKLSFEIEIKEDIQLILNEIKEENLDDNILESIKSTISTLYKRKEELIECLNDKVFKNINIEFNHESIISEITKKVENINTEINKHNTDKINKQTQISNLEKVQKKLLENKSIQKQKDDFECWFEIDKKEKTLRQKAKEINTRAISDLSKTAHDDLLTQNLETRFSDELHKLGYNNLEVKLVNKGASKGVVNTKLTIVKDEDLRKILSEGEQKAVALALFIAEAKMIKNRNPIILDDPVNSLDHKIAGRFANSLLQLDNQIIIFNHNRLFLDAFETSKNNHICKNIEGGCNLQKGKHIIVYQVNSEGKKLKGVLSNYKLNKAKEHIKEAKVLLNISPFNEALKVASLVRKAVECTIDEKIFNYQIPTKYSTKNSRINWDELKKLCNDVITIDSLKEIHSRVSGGELHNGTENEENPIEVEEFNDMIKKIEQILIR